MVNNTIAGEVYVLYQCGADAPPRSDFPVGTKFFLVPLTSLSAPETVPYAFVVSGGCSVWLMRGEAALQVPDACTAAAGGFLQRCPAPCMTASTHLPTCAHLCTRLRPQDFLGLSDRVHDVSPYVTSACGQALLACPDEPRASPDFEVLR